MNCIHCGSIRIRKNGHTHYGKQNYLCVSCGRQFVAGGQDWFINAKERVLIEKLLLERLSLRGICRVMDVSISWLLAYLKEVHQALPSDLNIIESLPDKEAYLDERFEEEIYRLLDKKKHLIAFQIMLVFCRIRVNQSLNLLKMN
jgi:transposase-like protein